jgi:hypothetical protein
MRARIQLLLDIAGCGVRSQVLRKKLILEIQIRDVCKDDRL